MTAHPIPWPRGVLGAAIAVGAIALAFALCVVVSWVAFGGTTVFQGPGLALRAGGWWIYVVEASLVAAVGFAVARRAAWAPSWLVALALVGAWVAEGVLLATFGWVLADELDGAAGAWAWWLATGGVVQPTAAVAGALVGRRMAGV